MIHLITLSSKHKYPFFSTGRKFLKNNFPKVYYFFVRFFSVIITLFIYRKFFFNGKKAHWFLQVKKGERYLSERWGNDFTATSPLRIPLTNVNKLLFPDDSGNENFLLNQYNPSIVASKNVIYITWRISDLFFDPATKSNGDAVLTHSVSNCNGVGYATILGEDLFKQPILRHPRILIEPVLSKRNSLQNFHNDEGRSVDFEDPRFIPENPNLILLHGRYFRDVNSSLPRFDVVVFNVETSEIHFLIPQNRWQTEKNWVPIYSDIQNYFLLRSTQPFAIVAVNRKDFQLTEQSWESSDFGKIHNGSNFLLLEEGFYIRVVRELISLNGLRDVRLNSIVMHDLELKEIGRTKPFLFQQFGFEICNSITSYEGQIIFAWGLNDSAGFLGSIAENTLVDWILNNLE